MADVGVKPDFWRGRRVLVTGDTGFKGAWLSLWLTELGARVVGYALEPPTTPSLFARAELGSIIHHIHDDVRDFGAVAEAMEIAKPDVIFHLAAQSLVLESYMRPAETYAVNVMGTVNVLEAVRLAHNKRRPERQAVIIVTSDKCYAQGPAPGVHRETDPMGGDDPYSSSKGCAELAVAAYRQSFADSRIGIASVRAGNVVGGGDWAKYRLIPDAVRAFLAKEPLVVRHPKATRPFQHILDPLAGYLMLAEALYEHPQDFCEGWNFGPDADSEATVEDVIGLLASFWDTPCVWEIDRNINPHEAQMLALDSGKARARLSWRPRLDLKQALKLSAEWYRADAASLGLSMREHTLAQIRDYGASY